MVMETYDVDLLIKVGVLLLVGGLIGSFYAETTCHFVSIREYIGYYEEPFHLHAGMYEYTSMDSVFTGHSFCLPYDGYYSASEPLFPRLAGAAALIAGASTSLILWTYLICMRTNLLLWKLGIFLVSSAALFQFSTFYFFFDDVCTDKACRLGPGAFMSLVAFTTYVLVAHTMSQNSPVSNDKSYKDNEHNADEESYYAAPSIV